MSYFFGITAVFALIFGSDYLIHGVLLKSAYQATASVWRPETEMIEMIRYMMAGQFLFAVSFCCLFLKMTSGKSAGFRTGISFGFWVGLILAGGNLIWYSVLPVPVMLAVQWCGYSFLQMVILGGVLGSLVLMLSKFSRVRSQSE